MADNGNCIDLTLDEDDASSLAVGLAASRSSSGEYQPALSRGETEEKRPVISFSSHEIKALSSSRIANTRLPDIMQHGQKKGVINGSDPSIFLAYVKENEGSCASLTLTNNVDPHIEPTPPYDFAYTDGYVLTDSLDKPSRRIDSTKSVPKGCNCNNDLGVCEPETCGCYQMHEALSPNPWVFQYKTNEDQSENRVDSDIRGAFAYTADGKLRREVVSWPQTPIWECNSNCSCSIDCRNRVVQRGRTVPLDIFKSSISNRGWGVRASQAVKKGTFITVYAGELIGYNESERRGMEYEKAGTTYLLDVDYYHIKRNLWVPLYAQKQHREGMAISVDEEEVQEAAEEWAVETDTRLLYTIDAGLWSNLARYLNHSCEPNLATFPVYTEERDLRRPFLAFFTTRNVAEGEELTFAYDGKLEGANAAMTLQEGDERAGAVTEALQTQELGTEIRVKKSDGTSLRRMICGCGTPSCRGALFI